MPGGILWDSDWDRLLASALRVADRFEFPTYIEIGTHEKKTSTDIIRSLREDGYDNFDYVGIDPSPPPGAAVPFHNYSHLPHRSHEAIGMVRGVICWAFIDGCHCAQCVLRDAILVTNRMPIGGEICFHDASPKTQGSQTQDYDSMRGHHDRTKAAEGIDVARVLNLNLIPCIGLIEPAPDQQYGGVQVYRKIEMP